MKLSVRPILDECRTPHSFQGSPCCCCTKYLVATTSAASPMPRKSLAPPPWALIVVGFGWLRLKLRLTGEDRYSASLDVRVGSEHIWYTEWVVSNSKAQGLDLRIQHHENHHQQGNGGLIHVILTSASRRPGRRVAQVPSVGACRGSDWGTGRACIGSNIG